MGKKLIFLCSFSTQTVNIIHVTIFMDERMFRTRDFPPFCEFTLACMLSVKVQIYVTLSTVAWDEIFAITPPVYGREILIYTILWENL